MKQPLYKYQNISILDTPPTLAKPVKKTVAADCLADLRSFRITTDKMAGTNTSNQK